MKKKYLAVLLAAGMVLSMAGCGNENDTTTDDGKETTQESTDSGEEEQTIAQSPTVALNYLDKFSEYVTLGKYDGIEYKKYLTDVTDKEVEEALNEEIEAAELFDKVDRKAEKGDYVLITYTGTIDGKADDNLGSGKDALPLKLGSGAYIPGFEDGLVGHGAKEEVVLDLTFPKDYKNADYAGKDVQFKVKIDSVNVLAKITDKLIKDNFGPEEGSKDGWNTIEEAKKEIKKNLEAEKKQESEDYKTTDIIDAFIEGCKFSELPQEIMDEYYEGNMEYYEMEAQYWGQYAGQEFTVEEFCEAFMGVSFEQLKKECKKFSEESVKEDMASWALAEKEGIELTDEEYEKRVNELYESYADSYGYTDVSQFVDNNGGEETVRYRLRIILVREWLLEHAVENGTYADRTTVEK